MKQLIFVLLLISCSNEVHDKFEVHDDFTHSDYNNFCLAYGHPTQKQVFSHLEGNLVVCKPAFVYDNRYDKDVPGYKPKDAMAQTLEYQRVQEEKDENNQ